MNGLKTPQKMGKANGMPSLPTAHTLLTKTRNVDSVDVFRSGNLFTFGPRSKSIALRGSRMVSINSTSENSPFSENMGNQYLKKT